MDKHDFPAEELVDVAIVGGAFSGAAMGLLLKRARPNLRILIIERSTIFDRKVGESTSEVAGCFLTRVLGLTQYLAHNHVAKQGLRLWFTRPENDCPGQCSEVGGGYQSRLPTYQLDRAELDQHLLSLAEKAGCQVWRPAVVREIQLPGEGKNSLLVSHEGQERPVRAKWIVDASGKAALLARKRGTLQSVPDHPTNAIWARFTGVGDLDSPELAARLPGWREAVRCGRGQATNHLMGYGWWCWIIPLRNGDVSAGLTWDTRLFAPAPGANLAERLQAHLLSHPIGRELFAQAKPVEKDIRAYSGLPYFSSEVMGDGWAAIGDAAGFMDPLYSQGLDYCGHTVCSVLSILLKSLDGECTRADAAAYNLAFRESYHRWLHALYVDKYAYLGDAELVFAAFLLDIAAYFIGPVRFVYEHQEREFAKLPYQGRAGGIVAAFMRFYNRRLSAIAQRRLAAGRYGSKNLGHRFLVKEGFVPTTKVLRHLRRGLRLWLCCEIKALFLPRPTRKLAPSPAPGSPLAVDA